jgi:hypothetical protein
MMLTGRGRAQRNVVSVAGIYLQWSLRVTTDRRIVRDKIHQEAERVVIHSTQLMSASIGGTLVHALRDVGTHCSI